MKVLRSVLTPRFWIGSLVIAVIYLTLNVYLTNYSLVDQTLLGNFSYQYKLELISALFGGLLTAISRWSFVMLLDVGVLTGMNMMLLFNKQQWAKIRSANFVAGFSTLFGTAGGGCASCGLPLLGLLGVSSSVGYLPFKGAELSVIAAGLLIFSFIVLLRQNLQVCMLKR